MGSCFCTGSRTSRVCKPERGSYVPTFLHMNIGKEDGDPIRNLQGCQVANHCIWGLGSVEFNVVLVHTSCLVHLRTCCMSPSINHAINSTTRSTTRKLETNRCKQRQGKLRNVACYTVDLHSLHGLIHRAIKRAINRGVTGCLQLYCATTFHKSLLTLVARRLQ